MCIRLLLILLCLGSVHADDKSQLFEKTKKDYAKKFEAVQGQYEYKKDGLNKAYTKATIQLARNQIVALKKIQREETKKKNIKGAIAARDMIKMLEAAIEESLNPKRTDKGKNYALATNGATAQCKTKPGNLIDGNTTEYTGSTGFGYGSFPCYLTVTLKEPTKIGLIKILLWDGDERTFKYTLETSVDGENWTMQADYSKEARKSWQSIEFKIQPVKFIRIKGLHNTANGGFHVVEIEAY